MSLMSETKDVAIVGSQVLSEAELNSYLDTFGIGKQLTDKERRQFIDIARVWNLNPFKREIYASVYGEGANRKCSIMTGYEVYIKRGERTGKLDGWDVAVEGEGEKRKAKLTIHRKDWSHPFMHEVYFSEAAQRKYDGSLNHIWAKMPIFMLRKVAISQGFRLCFSDELGGLPYADGELPAEDALLMRNVTPVKNVAPATDVDSATAAYEEAFVKNENTELEEAQRTAAALLKNFRGERHDFWLAACKSAKPNLENMKKVVVEMEAELDTDMEAIY